MSYVKNGKRIKNKIFEFETLLHSICIFLVHTQSNVGSSSNIFERFNSFSTSPMPFNSPVGPDQGVRNVKDHISNPNSDLILTMNHPVTPIIRSFTDMTVISRVDHINSMVQALRTATMTSQSHVLNLLQSYNIQTESLWLTNQIYVKGATPSIVRALKSVNTIQNIAEERKIPVLPIFNRAMGTPPNGTLWSIKKINAHKVWKAGSRGEGVVIAGIDTGVRATHKALKNNFVGTDKYGWYDPILYTKEPNDLQGHGTHTMGTMVGRYGIGAAPRAKWMACKGCGVQSCLQHALVACGQFVLCPTDPRSKNSNCSHIPHIVNNSWGGPGGQTWYDDVIAAWRAAGIIPFFANGNNGPDCETAGSPGDSEDVISVGATDKDDRLTKFSSRGPKIKMVSGMGLKSQDFISKMINMWGKRKKVTDSVKPDISAPGHQINSAGIITDYSYKVQSGTSMATPLVAGAAALLLAKNFKLTADELKQLMISTVEQNLSPSGTPQCGSIPETEFPNNMVGHGRLDIYKAYMKMMTMMDQSESEETDGQKTFKRKENATLDYDDPDDFNGNSDTTTSKNLPKKSKKKDKNNNMQ